MNHCKLFINAPPHHPNFTYVCFKCLASIHHEYKLYIHITVNYGIDLY